MTVVEVPNLDFELVNGVLTVRLAGSWTLTSTPPSINNCLAQLDEATTSRLSFDVTALAEWDSLLVSILHVMQRVCLQRNILFDASTLPSGLSALLSLAVAVPQEPQQQSTGMMGFADTWRYFMQRSWQTVREPLTFTGEMGLSIQRLLMGRANLRARDFWYFVGEAGPGALGIISLISILAGVILAYLGAVQLRQFGAQVYVANLVSIGMTREMGALMTAIIMAGRTGAAYAAQLGTMQANEEIDALKIMGIEPVDFLALPRLLALVLVLPLLTLYSDVLGMFGGSLIAGSMDIGLTQYINQTQSSIDMQQIFAGLFKSLVFAVVIALASCHWGLKSGRSSTDVGVATTKAVVASLVGIIVADSIINILYNRLGI
jgi:phospholipid/cholesterol/gamma-HCH transport system permease protein